MEHDAASKQPFEIKRGKLGGLKHLERLLGLREDDVLSTDAVFVSLDLEVAADRKKIELSTEKPPVTQLAFASLDTRYIRSLSESSDLKSLISVHMFQVTIPLKSKTAIKKMEKAQHCVFARTRSITSEELCTTVLQNLRIIDSLAGPENGHLRDIVLVGHSLGHDLRILQLLGINLASAGPISTTIDTHSISRFVFPPYHPNLPTAPGQDFSLVSVLLELGCQPPRSDFHNAGNDAVYSLYAMLLLAVKAGTARKAKLSTNELTNLETIRKAVSYTLSLYGHLENPESNNSS